MKKAEYHLIEDDLGDPGWIEIALVQLDIEAQVRLTAERLMDEMDETPSG